MFHQIEFVDKLNLETETPDGMLVLQVLVLRLRLEGERRKGMWYRISDWILVCKKVAHRNCQKCT